MDGRSCGFGGVPSDGASSAGNRGTGTDVLPEKKPAALDGASRQAQQNADGSLEASEMHAKSAGSGVVKKDLQKRATFPSSAAEVGQEDPCSHADGAPKDAAHAYQRSVSLPPPAKLISAMKGSRQKNGLSSPRENCHIKWAEDVYDPPVTSVSHSVNNSYKMRPNPRKKDKSKQKQKQKGRSKKKTKNTNQNPAVIQAPGLENLGTSIGMEAPADPGKHETDILDYGISSQDAKCGSSFLLETVAKMHFSTAEAS